MEIINSGSSVDSSYVINLIKKRRRTAERGRQIGA